MGHPGLTPQSGGIGSAIGARPTTRISPRSACAARPRSAGGGCLRLVLRTSWPAELAGRLRRQLAIPVGSASEPVTHCRRQVRGGPPICSGLGKPPAPFSPALIDGRGLAIEALQRWGAGPENAHPPAQATPQHALLFFLRARPVGSLRRSGPPHQAAKAPLQGTAAAAACSEAIARRLRP